MKEQGAWGSCLKLSLEIKHSGFTVGSWRIRDVDGQSESEGYLRDSGSFVVSQKKCTDIVLIMGPTESPVG